MFPFYPLLLIFGVVASYALWVPRMRRDPRLLAIYGASLFGAFAGAKLVYFAAEGYLYADHPQRWWIWATGKTILGALLGGYVAVECAKKSVGFEKTTGDLFALAAPVGIILGRLGCLLHGCCAGMPCESAWWTSIDALGVSRWPAVPVEITFNVVAVLGFFLLRKRACLIGQHFHLYLIGYGLFRFAPSSSGPHRACGVTSPDIISRRSQSQFWASWGSAVD